MKESEIGVDAETLWQAADKLRGSIDAAEYKHVVLGLIFLKYISDAFIARREKLAEELKAEGIEGKQAENLLEQRDEYTAENVFWVPPEARWDKIQARGKDPNIGKLIDDKIELNRQMNRTLEAMARAIFKAWFVDFEPVKAKADGATSFRGMPQQVFDQLPDRFTESELGPVPEGWEVKRLDECVHLTMGQSPPSEHYNKEGTGRPFHQGVSDYGPRFPTHRVYCTVDGRLAEPGDVLVSVRAPVGRINVADSQLVLGRGLAGLRHCRERQSFLLYYLYHTFAVEDAIGDGTIYKAVTKRFLSQMPILSPPEAIIDTFDELVCPFDDMIASLARECRTLSSLRDTLLPKLISGEIRVPKAMEGANDG